MYIKKIVFRFILPLILISFTTFSLLKFLPGSPFDGVDDIKDPLLRQKFNDYYQLDKPFYSQYFYFLKNFLTGNFGYSITHLGVKNNIVINNHLNNSLVLGFIAFLFSTLFGIGLGVVIRFKKLSQSIPILFISIPSFILAPILILLFSVYLRILPVGFLSSLKSYILPVIVLSWRPIGLWSRLVSHLIAEVESTLFFSAARAKGLSETQAITKHALKYIFADILSLFPPVFTQLVTGSILVEILFSIDGLGSLFLSAIIYRDITLVCILTLLFSVFLIFSRMIADSLSLYFDPRLRKLGH